MEHEIVDQWLESQDYRAKCSCGEIITDTAQGGIQHMLDVLETSAE